MSEAAAHLAARAFDAVAPVYDSEFGRNPIGLYFRHVVQERLRLLFPRGARVLDLGCGTGEDALFLASLGVEVHGIDVSPAMIEQARQKAARRGGVARSGPLRGPGRGGRGIASRAISTASSRTSAPSTARSCRWWARPSRSGLRAGRARCLLRHRPSAASRPRAGGADGRPARSPGARIGGTSASAPAAFLRASSATVSGPASPGARARRSGCWSRAPAHEAWARRNPIAFGVLAAVERLVREWPGVPRVGRPPARGRNARLRLPFLRPRAGRLRLLVLAVADRCDQRCVHCDIWRARRNAAEPHPGRAPRGRRGGARGGGATRPFSPAASRSCPLTCGRWPSASGGRRQADAGHERNAARPLRARASPRSSTRSTSASTAASLRPTIGCAARRPHARLRVGLEALRARTPRPRLVARSVLHARQPGRVRADRLGSRVPSGSTRCPSWPSTRRPTPSGAGRRAGQAWFPRRSRSAASRRRSPD